MDGVSMRFDETGLANNASRFHIIFKVILPQVKPGLIAAFVFNLIFVWNEFLFNFILGGRNTTTILRCSSPTHTRKAVSTGPLWHLWAPFILCPRWWRFISSRNIF